MTNIKKYVIIKENGIFTDRELWKNRSALYYACGHMRIPDRPFEGSGFTGKSNAYERSLEVAEILHMGVSDRKFGPSLPFPARRFWEIRTFVRVAAFPKNNSEIT